MQAILIYNGNSGGADAVSCDALQKDLQEAKFRPVYKRTERESDLDSVLKNAEGLVVAAGGDGTVQAVAKRLVGVKGVALSVIPMGTANNIAKSLGVEGSPEEIVKGLKNPRKRSLDMGRVKAPWGEDYFLEAAGVGLFADLLADYDPDEGKSPLRAADTIKEVLVDYDPQHFAFSLDGEDLSGRYIAVEVMNMKATGPRLELAPNADPSDGLFDVACVLEPDNVTLLDYIASLITGAFPRLENVELLKGRHFELAWQGEPIHLDDQLRPREVTEAHEQALRTSGKVVIENVAGALELWLPKGGGKGAR